MRIALVDDETAELASLQSRLETQLARLALRAEIASYTSGARFLAAARAQAFDLVFLDIYMENENGVESARALRRFDTECLLVFTTASAEHALDGFRVRAMQYLVKPYADSELAAVLDEARRRAPAGDRCVYLGADRVRLRDILYAEHFQHQIFIYKTDGQRLVTRKTFRAFTAELDDARFFPCSRGVVVNLEHAEDFDGACFVLRGGARVPVSRELVKAARQAFGDFLFGGGAAL